MEFMLIFLGGMLGSSHCLGMCGGFAVIVGLQATSAVTMATTQFAFTLGRVFTYSVLGVVAGSIGSRTTALAGWGINAFALLSIVAGLFLLVQGLMTLGIDFLPRRLHASGACLLASGYRSLLQSGGWPGAFLGGMLTGLLPCGLVYGFVTLAAATGDPLRGGAVMATFGLGTAPLMVAAGWGGALLSNLARRRLLKLAAACVALIGIITVTRGVSYLNAPVDGARPVCPFCISQIAQEQGDVA